MSGHQKFILEALPKSAVVNSVFHNKASEVEEIIISAVSEHLSKIIDNEGNNEQDIEKDKDKEDNLQILAESIEIGEVDINKIKQEAYNLGLQEANQKNEEEMSQLRRQNNLSELLHEKLSAISLVTDLDSQIAKVSAESIATIAKKLHLILPANFEEIISKGLLEKLKNFYKEGEITLTIHPDKYDFCTEALRSDDIPDKLKDNFKIVKDSTVDIDDCKLEWLDTCLEYNKQQLALEIDKIIEQLGTC